MMLANILSAMLIGSSFVTASPILERQMSDNGTTGLSQPIMTPSSNGSATCVTGMVSVYASTDRNVALNLPTIDNQTVVTGITNDMLAAGSTFMQTAVGGMTTVSGTYQISAQLCYPASNSTSTNQSSTVQFLTHGIGFDKTYWDVAPDYSYIDSAASNGYPTFSYDRLAVGLSEHPANASIVQAPLELAIAHALVQHLRNGTFGTAFSSVIGVGHSFGSAITQGLTNTYPSDLDAAVLTGFSVNQTGIATFTAALDLSIANNIDPVRFANLSNEYLVSANAVGNQFSFFKAQGFPPANLAIGEASKQTVTFGELLTLAAIVAPASNFTGPVDVVNGAADWPFCMGNCSYPTDLAAAVAPMLYPASNTSQSYLAPGAGHGVNLHYAAGEAYQQIQTFLRSAGL